MKNAAFESQALLNKIYELRWTQKSALFKNALFERIYEPQNSDKLSQKYTAGRPAVPKFLSYSMSEILVQRLREASELRASNHY